MRFAAIAALFVCSALAQSPDRVFHFANTQTAGFQQVALAIRTITEAPQVTVDDAAATLQVQGTADQLAMADWLFTALDKPAVGQPPAQHAASSDYPVPGSQEVVRVYYLAHSETPQSLQEMLNITRSNAEIQRAFVCAGPKALALRGTTGQLGVAGFLIDALDKPTDQPNQHSMTAAFTTPFPQAPVTRVFYLANAINPQQVQEFINMTRSVSDMQRVFPYNSLKALALRGTADQMALAEWLFNAIDKPVPQTFQHTASAEYLVPEASGFRIPVVRIYFLAHAETAQSLQEIVNVVRSTADVQRVYPYHALKAVTVRGTAAQVALASWLFDTLDQAAQNSATPEFRVAGASDDVAQVFWLTHTSTAQAVQELTNAIRTTADLKRVFPYMPPKALTVRGTPGQLAMAAQVIQQRDK